jgi:hypothetical protein
MRNKYTQMQSSYIFQITKTPSEKKARSYTKTQLYLKRNESRKTKGSALHQYFKLRHQFLNHHKRFFKEESSVLKINELYIESG